MASKQTKTETGADPQQPTAASPATAGQAEAPLEAAQAAELVDVEPGEVLGFRDYGDRVVVITTSGQRLEARR